MTAHDVTRLAHAWIAPALAPGALAVDATAGAGHDTLFLAAAVGDTGRVHAFDIQADAIARSRERVAAAGLSNRVSWHATCHSLAPERIGRVAVNAVMFNLGWLPGGDHTLVTRPATTRLALDALTHRLCPGGRLSVIAYRGHEGGTEEERAVHDWFGRLPGTVMPLVERAASASPRAPVLRVVERGNVP
ncbi:MAG: class I SAM-dependent methyltransferase [Halofilum sp. (in: g-proteobacteria)]|nr:class I SAM-dependent methyltransferase [Halofilum sp. (in: g-proteobacteria)]